MWTQERSCKNMYRTVWFKEVYDLKKRKSSRYACDLLRRCRGDGTFFISQEIASCERKSLRQDAHPLFHSDRGFQYTSQAFYSRLKKHHMKQSMSRVAHCIDNGPMEGFLGILKQEMYYCQHFNDRTTLIAAITDYINYYNNQRLQRKLNVMTPMEYHNQYIKVA